MSGSDASGTTYNVNTGGGDYAERDIYKQTIVTAAVAQDVRGLPNPFLGLAAFTYSERARYAGRDALIQATVKTLTEPGAQQTLLFVTGASGAGKSSFAQAGLLPALERHYQERHLTVRHAVMRPGMRPLAALADALMKLGLAATPPFAAAQPFMVEIPNVDPSDGLIALLVIDQFEEFFTQSDPAQCAELFTILTSLPSFTTLRMHIVCTLRADYLPDLFEHSTLYSLAKQGVDLRAMSELQLREAIQQPIYEQFPDGEKRFESALVEELASAAAGDPSYLPLLQVTLEELWRGGNLSLAAYTGHDLSHAIGTRADAILASRTDGQARSPEEQAEILRIFLDLVQVAFDDSAIRRDVRRRRALAELIEHQPARRSLIDELAQARLLSLSLSESNPPVELVDIIHERLITNWERLQTAIDTERVLLRQRSYFEQALREWEAAEHPEDYLLVGVRLAEAKELANRNDVSLQRDQARTFLGTSIAAYEAEQQQKLEQAQRLVETERQRAEQEHLRAEERMRAATQLRRGVVILSIITIMAIVSAIAAWLFWEEANNQKLVAVQQEQITRAGELAALSQLERDQQLSLLLAIEAYRATKDPLPPTSAALQALTDGLMEVGGANASMQVLRHEASVPAVVLSADGHTLVTGSNDGTVLLWNLGASELNASRYELAKHTDSVVALALSADGRRLVAGSHDGTVLLWDLGAPDPRASMRELRVHTASVKALALSVDGRMLVTGSYDNTARVWDLGAPDPSASVRLLAGHGDAVVAVALSADQRAIVTGSRDKTAGVWDLATTDPTTGMPTSVVLTGHDGAVNALALSADGHTLVTGSADKTARVWNLDAIDLTTGMPTSRILTGHDGAVNALALSADGHTLVTGSDDHTVRVWDLADSKASARVLRGHIGPVSVLSLNANEYTLVTANSCDQSECDPTARVWDLRIADPNTSVQVLRGHTESINAIALSADAPTVVTGSKDRTAWIWKPDPEYLLGLACQLAGRNMTYDEWVRININTGREYDATCQNLPFHFTYGKYLFDQAMNAVRNGEVDSALKLIERSEKLVPNFSASADDWNTICWSGTLWRYAEPGPWAYQKEILNACELSVTLAPGNSKFRESRAVAYAVAARDAVGTVDYSAIIADFEAFIVNPPDESTEANVEHRRRWINELRAGHNPFDAALLEYLRNE